MFINMQSTLWQFISSVILGAEGMPFLFLQWFEKKNKNRSTAELSSWEYVWWGLFLFFFPPASQSDTQTWPRAGGRAGGVGRAPASRAGRPELWEMEAQAATQEDAPSENRRLEDIPVECRDQRIHGSLWKELEWVDEERRVLCCWVKGRDAWINAKVCNACKNVMMLSVWCWRWI